MMQRLVGIFCLIAVSTASAGRLANLDVYSDKIYRNNVLAVRFGESFAGDFMIRLLNGLEEVKDREDYNEVAAFVQITDKVLEALSDASRSPIEIEREVKFQALMFRNVLSRGQYTMRLRQKMAEFDFAGLVRRYDHNGYRKWATEFLDLVNNLRPYLSEQDFRAHLGPTLNALTQYMAALESLGIMHKNTFAYFQDIERQVRAAEPALAAISGLGTTAAIQSIVNVRTKINEIPR